MVWWKKVIFAAAAACLFPYVVTLGWTGRIAPSGDGDGGRQMAGAGEQAGAESGQYGSGLVDGEQSFGAESGGQSASGQMGNGQSGTTQSGGGQFGSDQSRVRRIILDRDRETVLDAEEYLIGVVTMQMPIDYELEALKAQAVIARTYIYSLMGDAQEIAESALDMDYLEKAQMEKLWGTRNYMEFYQKARQAVEETAGMVMQVDGAYIDPLFTRCSAGKTRQGDESRPYLSAVECPSDPEAEDFLQILEWTPEEFSYLVSQIPDGGPVSADQVPESIQIGSRDGSGYVELVQIGGYSFTGDELRYGLGLNSSCFQLEAYQGNVRAVVQGIGHGYGFSQHEANRKAAQGWTWEELLHYFYKNISILSV